MCVGVWAFMYLHVCGAHRHILILDIVGVFHSQIGHQDRKAGPYGACFSTEADTIFVSRPGLRLWKAQASGGTVT